MNILMYIVQNEYQESSREIAKQNAVMARTEIDFVDQDMTKLLSDRNAVTYEINNNETDLNNETLLYNVSLNEDYIFDRTDVKVIFITLYTIVFVCCFFGNLMVIFVVTFSRRLRSITNFFLANLAVADFCVGIFCVYQTLINYLMNSWQLGDFLCKVYMFVHALSYTASILILVVVCTERYLAIVHPIKCRSMLTRSRLRIVIGVVWILAAVYASPRFFYVETISNQLNTGDVDIICIANIKKHNKNVLDAVNLVFLYLLPLSLMSCLYTRIAVGLWRSSATLEGPGLVARSRNGRVHHIHTSSRNVLRARRGVIRMLIAVVMMFAICNLPQQARIVWRHWGSNYDRTSDFSTLLTVSTFLISYMNSCLNPLLYAFLSRNFRKGMRELLRCKGSRDRSGALAMVCTSGDHTNRHENGVSTTNLPQTSVVRLSSVQDNPCTTQTIARHSIYDRNT
ncbi:trissin receptor-like [Nylanderia fulva]|uniref:trissin receptor-like n=1 Tax=Nylanderia fulva TaxID=613905 RepID=UPI0010FAF2B8|nr:trissin receptor-like [Nylanderia fulva]XP_029178692.1 trissin receptor-like [Nylanderia fulva]